MPEGGLLLLWRWLTKVSVHVINRGDYSSGQKGASYRQVHAAVVDF